MNNADLQTFLIRIQRLAVRQGGYLEALRESLPSLLGENAELDQFTAINNDILEEVTNAQNQITEILVPRPS